jgi:hypothetical protein
LNGAGGTWPVIPFTFVGSMNNEPSIDPSPLYDMAEVNIAHYRNSADYEDSVFICGQPQPYITGLDEQWKKDLEDAGVYIGSRSAILLPEGGTFGMAQAKPNTLAKEAMDQKEEQMVALGARLIQPGSAIKTATQAQSDNENEHSVLSLAVANVNEAYMTCIGWMQQFMGDSGEALYEISQDFTAPNMDAQMLTALVASWQSGALPNSDLWESLRRAGLIDPEKTDDEVRDEIEAAGGSLMLEDAA